LLLERARRAGADVCNERVTRIAGTSGDWQLITPQGEYRASYCAGNGRTQSVPRAVPLADFSQRSDGHRGLLHPRPQFYDADSVSEGITGYIWVFPRIDHVSAGIAAKMARSRPRSCAAFWSVGWKRVGSKNMVSSEWPALGRRPLLFAHPAVVSHPDFRNARSLRRRLGHDRRQRGLVDPITGEGLYYALRSAELCAGALLAGALTSTRPVARRCASRVEAGGTRLAALLPRTDFRRQRSGEDGVSHHAKHKLPRPDERSLRRSSRLSRSALAAVPHPATVMAEGWLERCADLGPALAANLNSSSIRWRNRVSAQAAFAFIPRYRRAAPSRAFRAHLFVHLADYALGSTTKLVRSQNFIPFHSAWRCRRLHQAGVGVGEQVDSKGELVAEFLCRPRRRRSRR